MEHYGILIKKLDKVFKQNFNQELERVGLTFSQMRVLRFIEDNPKMKITQKDISNELDIQHSTTIGLLKRMQEKGLVRVVVDEDNRRCRNIFLTKKAEDIRYEMERGREIMESRVVKSFTDEEKETFYRLLNKAIDNLKD
ncbi:MAG: MarR family transcriptional regulator [Eubacterium sp.]|uniref:MarR family winged helix-turn-helix transcriptional regulator n=1 Tax=Eubacterium sp. TaxID=142586 RepID=UPI00300EEBB1